MSTMSSEELKALGNEAYGQKQYEKAIEHYTSAIKLDAKNHVFFSNRSASYAGLEQWEKSAADAKECIRLDPTFVKGYYRLASAQIAVKAYEQAAATIRQGLVVEPKNNELLKQQKMVQQQLKRVQDTPGRRATSAPNVNAALSSEYQDLVNQYNENNRKLETLKLNLVKTEREQKIAELTKEELAPLPTEAKCFRSVGKMFLLSSRENVMKYLDGNVSEAQEKQEDMKKEMSYLEQKMQSQQQNMEELRKSASSE